MGRECPVSGKKTSFGNHKTERGKAKYLGGVGKKTTGVSRRTLYRTSSGCIWLPNGTTRYVRVATSVIRSGELTLEVDGKMQTFPLIKAAKGSAAARERLEICTQSDRCRCDRRQPRPPRNHDDPPPREQVAAPADFCRSKAAHIWGPFSSSSGGVPGRAR